MDHDVGNHGLDFHRQNEANKAYRPSLSHSGFLFLRVRRYYQCAHLSTMSIYSYIDVYGILNTKSS